LILDIIKELYQMLIFIGDGSYLRVSSIKDKEFLLRLSWLIFLKHFYFNTRYNRYQYLVFPEEWLYFGYYVFCLMWLYGNNYNFLPFDRIDIIIAYFNSFCLKIFDEVDFPPGYRNIGSFYLFTE